MLEIGREGVVAVLDTTLQRDVKAFMLSLV